MRKAIALVLCLFAAAVMTACGSKATTTVGSVAASQGETVSSEAAGSEVADITPDFDTDWAHNAFEMLLPKPPYDDWVASQPNSPHVYSLTRFNTADWDDEAAWNEQRDVFYAYVNGLTDYGFTVEEEFGPNCTQVDVYNAAGDRFTFTDYGGEYNINFNTANGSQIQLNTAAGN